MIHSGTSVYFALAANGQELVARKLKTKQLPQLKPSLVKNLLKIRHPNLIKFEEFIILKVSFVFLFVLQLTCSYFRTKHTCFKNWQIFLLADGQRIKRSASLSTNCICVTSWFLGFNIFTKMQLQTFCCFAINLNFQNIAHKDLRPVNILLNQSGRLIVTNFGIVPHVAPNKVFPRSRRKNLQL